MTDASSHNLVLPQRTEAPSATEPNHHTTRIKPSLSIYEEIRRDALERFSGTLQGSPDALFCVVSTTPLSEQSKHALQASAQALGYSLRQYATLSFDQVAELSGHDAMSTSDVSGDLDGSNVSEASDVAASIAGSDIANASFTGTTTTASTSDATGTSTAKSSSANDAPSHNDFLKQAQELFLALEAIDPFCIVCCDLASTRLASAGYNTPLALETKVLLLGHSCCCFENFNELMGSDEGKRKAWACLKTLPHLTK